MQQIKTGRPVEVIPEPLIEIPVEAYLDSDYIGDAMHKIEIYQKIAAVRDNDRLEQIFHELADRFGEPPVQVLNLLEVAKIRNYARRIGIEKIVQTPMFLEIYFRGAPHIRPEGMLALSNELQSALKVLQERNLLRIALRALAGKRALDFVLDIVEKLAA